MSDVSELTYELHVRISCQFSSDTPHSVHRELLVQECKGDPQ